MAVSLLWDVFKLVERHQIQIPYGPKQIRYQIYMQKNDLQDGDYHCLGSYQIWLSKQSEQFRLLKGLHRFDSFAAKGLQEAFTAFLQGGEEHA